MTQSGIEKTGMWVGLIGSSILPMAIVSLMHFVPPPSPVASAAQIAAIYREHSLAIRIGGIIMLSSAAMLVPFFAVLSSHMQKIEPLGFPMAKAQLMLGNLALFTPISITAVLWMTAAYRTERSDESIQMLNDIGWLLFFSPVVAGMLQVLSVAAVIFADKSAEPRFPRWFAYYSLWIGILFLPPGALPLFKTGLLAWNGLVGFWLAITAFGLWFLPMTFLLFRATYREAATAAVASR